MPKTFRAVAIGLVVALCLGCVAIVAGLRYNGTHSFPMGLYLATHKRPEKGDLVFVKLPPYRCSNTTFTTVTTRSGGWSGSLTVNPGVPRELQIPLA
jgi:type IV secretory pathway protease TraF